MLNRTIDYANQYLNELVHYPGYGRGNFEKLAAMKIEEDAKPFETILNVLRTEADVIGINSASGRPVNSLDGFYCGISTARFWQPYFQRFYCKPDRYESSKGDFHGINSSNVKTAVILFR